MVLLLIVKYLNFLADDGVILFILLLDFVGFVVLPTISGSCRQGTRGGGVAGHGLGPAGHYMSLHLPSCEQKTLYVYQVCMQLTCLRPSVPQPWDKKLTCTLNHRRGHLFYGGSTLCADNVVLFS
jgi:hypothetical protein